MALNRLVNTHFWDDGYIVTLDPTEKLIFLYLLTNPQTNIAGTYELQPRRIAFDTGIDSEMVLKVLNRFEKAGKITYKDGWICLHNWVKHQTSSPSVKAGIERVLSDAPAWTYDIVCRGSIDRPYTVPTPSDIPNLTKPYLTKPSGGTKRATRFPKKFDITDDMRSWAKKKYPRIPIDSETEKFADYHQAKGNTFKDWTAAWRSWMRKAAEFKPDYKATERESYKNECPY